MKTKNKESPQPFTCNSYIESNIFKAFVLLKSRQDELILFVKNNDLMIYSNYNKFLELQKINYKIKLLCIKNNLREYELISELKSNSSFFSEVAQ